MKTTLRSLLRGLALLLLLGAHFSTLLAQNTAFTYQGRLNTGGSPANGVYDFTFQAFDAPAGGSSVGGTVNVNGVAVTNGLFTALVDLGSSPFTGPARWLQIRVSTNGTGSFTTLAPRQALTPSPYAIYANSAGTVTNGGIANAQLAANAVAAGNIQNSAITAGKIASGQVVKSLNGLTDAVSLTQGANVTINTVGNSLQISAPAGGMNLPFSGSASSTGSVFTLSNSGTGPAGAFLGSVGIGTTAPRTKVTIWTPNVTGVQEGLRINNPIGFGGTDNGSALVFSQDRDPSENFVNATIQGAQELIDSSANAYLAFSTKAAGSVTERMRVTGAGHVGIGTTTPQSKLHVVGGAAVIDHPSGGIRVTKTTGQLNVDDLGIWNRGNSGGQPFAIADYQTGSKGVFINTISGNVGIGATTPLARLDVRGDIRLGSSGQFRATSGEENLRIIRGAIDDLGQIVRGTGFTCERIENAKYRITFNTPFSGPPDVGTTGDRGIGGVVWPGFDFGSPTATQMTIVTYWPPTEDFRNGGFSFIAIGPR